jgi:hypothetical protein
MIVSKHFKFAVLGLLMLGGTRTWAATGDAAFVAGNYEITPSADGSSAITQVAGIRNTTASTTTGSLGFELWYSSTPYGGGSINGYKVASSYLPIGNCTSPQLSPGQSCTGITVTDTLSEPTAGTYYPVMLLVEYSSSCATNNGYCIDDFVDLTNLTTGGPTVAIGTVNDGGSGAIGNAEMAAPVQVSGINWTADTVDITVTSVTNISNATSGSLAIQLWFTATPYTGGAISSGYRVASFPLPPSCTTGQAQLNAGMSCDSINSGTISVTPPPPGTYYAAVVLVEYSPSNCPSNAGYCVDNGLALQNEETVPEPTVFVGSAITGGGGGGGLDWPVILALAALAAIGCLRKKGVRLPATGIALTALVGLSGCGGGGGSRGGDGAAPLPASPTITAQPQNISVQAGQSAIFSVTAAGSAPLSYQWQLGGVAISGATSNAYTVAETTALDNGNVYAVVVSNAAGSVTSTNATLSVMAAASTGTIVVTETSGGPQVNSGGAFVLVDGVAAGTLNGSGTASVAAPAGSHTVTILDSGARGDVTVSVVANQATPAAVAVSESDAAFASSIETIPQIVGGIFDTTRSSNNPALVLLADSNGKPIIVSTFSGTLQGQTIAPIELSSTSSVTSGTASVDLSTAIRALGAGSINPAANDSPLLLQFEATDSSGIPYGGSVSFEVGEFLIQGQVYAPPSNAALPVGSLKLTFSKHSSAATAIVISASDGSFTTSGVPPGTYDVTASITSGGVTYNVFGSFTVNGNTGIKIVPLAPTDLANGVSPVQVNTIAGGQKAAGSKRLNRAKTHVHKEKMISGAIQSGSALQSVPASGPYGNVIDTTAGAQDTPSGQSMAYSIPVGTTSIDILYQVCTQEYPTYVDAQSQYNDLWSVNAVDSSGKVLLSASHSVNEQLTAQPVWGPDGCTGVIDTPVTIAAGASVTLSISATNIGDDQLATTVTAIVSTGGLSIKTFALQPWTTVSGGGCTSTASSQNTSNIVVCQSANNGDYIAIPASGSLNTFARPAMAVLQNTGSALPTISNVEVDLVDLSGNKLDTLINEAPGDLVQQVTPGALTFPITYTGTKTSGVATPPERITYLLTVSGTDQSQNPVTASANLTVFNTMIRATAHGVSLGRYGVRDLGGDDWTTQNGINWLTTNSALLTRFDDVSGEHGRNLGHRTHGKGTEVDIFQFLSLNSTSGLLNYNSLRDAAVKAAAGDSTSIQTVANWVKTNRTGIAALMAAPNVSYIYAGVGTCFSTLSQGWLESAMLSGTLLVFNGTGSACTAVGPPNTVDLGVGPWSPPGNITFNTVHNSHIHIGLAF